MSWFEEYEPASSDFLKSVLIYKDPGFCLNVQGAANFIKDIKQLLAEKIKESDAIS